MNNKIALGRKISNPICKKCQLPYVRNTYRNDKLGICKNCKLERIKQYRKDYYQNKLKK